MFRRTLQGNGVRNRKGINRTLQDGEWLWQIYIHYVENPRESVQVRDNVLYSVFLFNVFPPQRFFQKESFHNPIDVLTEHIWIDFGQSAGNVSLFVWLGIELSHLVSYHPIRRSDVHNIEFITFSIICEILPVSYVYHPGFQIGWCSFILVWWDDAQLFEQYHLWNRQSIKQGHRHRWLTSWHPSFKLLGVLLDLMDNYLIFRWQFLVKMMKKRINSHMSPTIVTMIRKWVKIKVSSLFSHISSTITT